MTSTVQGADTYVSSVQCNVSSLSDIVVTEPDNYVLKWAGCGTIMFVYIYMYVYVVSRLTCIYVYTSLSLPFSHCRLLPSRNDREDSSRGYHDSYRDSSSSSYRDGGYRGGDRYRDRDRRYSYDDSRWKDYQRYDDYYDRYDYDRYRSSRGYDHYPDRYYESRHHDRDHYGKYGDYRGVSDYSRRSRSPGSRGDYYSSKDRSRYNIYDYTDCLHYCPPV